MEDLESILSKRYVDVRAEQLKIGPLQYKQGLRDALSSGEIDAGKTHYETLGNYENYFGWCKFKEGVQDKLNRLVWAGIGIITTAIPNYFIGNWLRILPQDSLESKEKIYQFAAFSLGAFIIEKRILTGIINYWGNTLPNGIKMKKKDCLKLLSGYVLAQFPFIKSKGQKTGQKIIDFYTKNSSSENEMNAAKERRRLYEDLSNASRKTQETP